MRLTNHARRATVLLACTLACLGLNDAAAQADWPSRPIRLVVPLPPGPQPDVVARLIAESLAGRLKQPVLVENRPGARTNLAMEMVAQAAPDGYTFLYALTSLAINPALYELSFDPLTDLAPVMLLVRGQMVLVGNPKLPARSLRELVDFARSKPDGLRCAHSGGITDVACALFQSLSGARVTTVPFRASAQALAPLMAGDVDLLFDGPRIAHANVRAGRARAYGATDPSISAAPFEGLPALAEVLPGFDLTTWNAILAPAGTPRNIIARVNAEITSVLEQPDTRKRIIDAGQYPAPSTPEAFAELQRREQARFARLLREARLHRPEEASRSSYPTLR